MIRISDVWHPMGLIGEHCARGFARQVSALGPMGEEGVTTHIPKKFSKKNLKKEGRKKRKRNEPVPVVTWLRQENWEFRTRVTYNTVERRKEGRREEGRKKGRKKENILFAFLIDSGYWCSSCPNSDPDWNIRNSLRRCFIYIYKHIYKQVWR